jgi:uncharacterized protein YegL
MKKNLTELVFILDRSGSMRGLEKDTIGGFNGMLDKQREEEGDANITTVLFDDQYEKVHDRLPLDQVKDLTSKEYYVRGCTALLDAIGRTIYEMGLIQKHLPDSEKAGKVIVVITTDGLENASHEYSRDKVKTMIEHEKEKYGWEFLFLGANMDAVAEAGSLGIGADRSVTFENDSQGIELNYEVVGRTLCQMRACAPSAAPMGAEWKEDIEEDYNKRKKGLFGRKK